MSSVVLEPADRLQCLKKRYERAIHATRSAVDDLAVGSSTWLMQTSTWPTIIQWDVVRALRLGVLGVIDFWLQEGGGPQDCLDDPSLYLGLLSFISGPSPQVLSLAAQDGGTTDDQLQDIGPAISKIAVVLREKALRPALDTEMALPSVEPSVTSGPTEGTSIYNGSAELLLDFIAPSELVDRLDNVAATTFNKVTEIVSRSSGGSADLIGSPQNGRSYRNAVRRQAGLVSDDLYNPIGRRGPHSGYLQPLQ